MYIIAIACLVFGASTTHYAYGAEQERKETAAINALYELSLYAEESKLEYVNKFLTIAEVNRTNICYVPGCERGNCRLPAKLELHLHTHVAIKPYGCSMCPEKHTQLYNAFIHSKKCGGKLTCTTCKEQFDHQAGLKKHVESDHPRHRCKACGEKFAKLINFRKHKTIHVN